MLREYPDELICLLKLTPVSREEYNQSWNTNTDSELERARKFYVRVRQSFYGLGIQRKNKGWHMVKTISRTNMGETVSKWHNAIEKLPDVVEKLTHIQIENRDYREVIETMDYENAFFYCDPPYPHECRQSKNDYRFEFSDEDHIELSEILNQIKGKAMVSSYECPLMKSLYEDSGWRKIKFPPKKNNIRSTVVQEVIYMNYSEKDQIKQHGALYENLKLRL
jgi:DNA adenine methylase